MKIAYRDEFDVLKQKVDLLCDSDEFNSELFCDQVLIVLISL